MINPLKCPKCGAVPLALLQKDNTLNLDCDCGYRGICTLEELFNNKLVNAKDVNFNCGYQQHNEKGIQFCINCQVWLCQQCFNKHNEYNNNHKFLEYEIKLNTKCKYHKFRDVKYYCEKCQKKFCEICKSGLYIAQDLIFDKDNAQIENYSTFDNVENENNKNYNECNHKFQSIALLKENKEISINELFIKAFSPEHNSPKENYYLFRFLKMVLEHYDLTQIKTNYYTLQNVIENFDVEQLIETKLDSVSLVKYSKTTHNIDKNYEIILKEKSKHSLDNGSEVYCMKILKDGRLAISMNEGLILFYILPEFKKDSEIKENNFQSMYYIHEMENENIIVGSDFSIFIYEKIGKNYKQVKELSNVQQINQIISLNQEIVLSISKNNILYSHSSFFPNSVLFVQQFTQYKNNQNYQTFLNLVYKLTESKILLGFSDHIEIFNYNTKRIEITINSTSAKSNQSICEYKEYLILGGMKTISFLNKTNYQVVFRKNVGFDSFFIKNVGVSTLLIGGDDYFYTFNDLNHQIKTIEKYEVKNPVSLELGDNKLLIAEQKDFNFLKIFEYSLNELE